MGYGFNLVSCPNYLFETVAWTAITVMTGSYAGEPHFFYTHPGREAEQ